MSRARPNNTSRPRLTKADEGWRSGRAARVPIWIGGVLLWVLGLQALDVSAGLSLWRHCVDAAMLVFAVHAWTSVDAVKAAKAKE